MKNLSLILIALFVVTSMLSAQWKWVPLEGGSLKPTPVQIKLLNSTAQEIKFEVIVGGYLERPVDILGKECIGVHIPDCSALMERGFPTLPRFSKPFQVRASCDVEVVVLEKQEVDIKLTNPIAPSKGHFTRDIHPDTVPFEFGPIYKEDVFWPEEKDQFTAGKPFVFRDVRGILFNVLPIRVNHVQMQMKVLKRAVIALRCEGESVENVLTTTSRGHSKTFSKMYQDFVGYKAPSILLEGDDNPDQKLKTLIVVVPDQYEQAIQEWVAWKKKCGYTVTVKSVKSGITAGEIKAYLQTQYPFGYLVLIGDAAYNSNFEISQPMPTFKGKMEKAAADRVYVRLAGKDNYPDAFVSRISARDAAGVAAQLLKIIRYEGGAEEGDWVTKGICIASDQGSPTDKQRADWLIYGGTSGQKVSTYGKGLSEYGYTMTRIYDPSASSSAVTAAVNPGTGIICYIGHGSASSWGTTGFNSTQAKALTNGLKMPVIWSVACVNGQFVHNEECFAEAWLRNTNGGAVAMEAGSTNEAWVPPCDKQTATINGILKKTHTTFGALECQGALAALQYWQDTDSSQGNQLVEQCNLFGDCSMIVRTKKIHCSSSVL